MSPRPVRPKTHRHWLHHFFAFAILGVLCAFLPGVWIVASCAFAPRPDKPAQVFEEPYRGLPDALRPASATYLTVPEWFVVYSTDEYASWLRHDGASAFPYFHAVADYWG